MRSLIDILEDERRLVYKIGALDEAIKCSEDIELLHALYTQHKKYKDQLHEVRNELLECFERFNRQRGV